MSAWRRWQRPDAYVRGGAAFPGAAPSGVGPRATLRVLTVAIDWTRRVACAHCRAVWARELGCCPSCGATAAPPG